MFELSDNELRAIAGGIRISNGGRGGRGGRGGDAEGAFFDGNVNVAGDGNNLGNGFQTGGVGGNGGAGGAGGNTDIDANVNVA
jgi:hypothetical protein